MIRTQLGLTSGIVEHLDGCRAFPYFEHRQGHCGQELEPGSRVAERQGQSAPAEIDGSCRITSRPRAKGRCREMRECCLGQGRGGWVADAQLHPISIRPFKVVADDLLKLLEAVTAHALQPVAEALVEFGSFGLW